MAQADTQAPPVDTSKPKRARKAQSEADAIIKRGRGRPVAGNPKSSRAEYQRELMRKRRQRLKEQGK